MRTHERAKHSPTGSIKQYALESLFGTRRINGGFV